MKVFAVVLGVLCCVVAGGMADMKVPLERQPRSGNQAYFSLPRIEVPDRKARDVQHTLAPGCASNQICMYVMFNRETQQYADYEIMCTCAEGLECRIAGFDAANYRYLSRCATPIASRTTTPPSISKRSGVISDIHPEDRVGQLRITEEL